MKLAVRHIQESDIEYIKDYWLTSSESDLRAMGADPQKMPTAEYWEKALKSQLETPMEQKQSLATIWLVDDIPVGHCNVNNIQYGVSAHMHLHVWKPGNRNKGAGAELVKLSMKLFFEELKLGQLICEPYAHNPAPNRALERLGFLLEKEYITIPGSINFEQPVKRWVFNQEQLENL